MDKDFVECALKLKISEEFWGIKLKNVGGFRGEILKNLGKCEESEREKFSLQFSFYLLDGSENLTFWTFVEL